MFHISRLKKAANTAAEAVKLELSRWMRQGFSSKITVEDKDYEISGIVGHHDYAPDGETEFKRESILCDIADTTQNAQKWRFGPPTLTWGLGGSTRAFSKNARGEASRRQTFRGSDVTGIHPKTHVLVAST